MRCSHMRPEIEGQVATLSTQKETSARLQQTKRTARSAQAAARWQIPHGTRVVLRDIRRLQNQTAKNVCRVRAMRLKVGEILPPCRGLRSRKPEERSAARRFSAPATTGWRYISAATAQMPSVAFGVFQHCYELIDVLPQAANNYRAAPLCNA